MPGVLLLTRIVFSLVAGWFLLVVPMGIAALLGLHAWGFFHSGIALLCLPLTIGVTYAILGRFPPFKSPASTSSSDRRTTNPDSP